LQKNKKAVFLRPEKNSKVQNVQKFKKRTFIFLQGIAGQARNDTLIELLNFLNS